MLALGLAKPWYAILERLQIQKRAIYHLPTYIKKRSSLDLAENISLEITYRFYV